MVDHGDFARGIACLDRAEYLLNRGNGGEPPSASSLEQLRAWLHEARVQIDTAKVLLRE